MGDEEAVVAVGNYILLIGIACIVGILTKWLTHIPYTIALVVVGLVLAFIPPELIGISVQKTFSKDIVFFVLLPPLLFQGAIHLQLDRLKRHTLMVGVLATVGVLITTLIIGQLSYSFGIFDSMKIAFLFGALICTTDPVSVLSIFRQAGVSPNLKYMVEGESLFNDGTGVVIFLIVLGTLNPGSGTFSIPFAFLEFLKVGLGGAGIGLIIGVITYQILKRLTDHLLENTICLVSCYGSFWLAEHVFHLSGVIAVVTVGLLIGNYGRKMAMSPKTTVTIETFFESLDFIINSLLFILIGLELQAIDRQLFLDNWSIILLAIAIVLIGRLIVYPLYFILRPYGGKDSSGQRLAYPPSWSHILFWGGLRGSIPIALLLGLKGQLPTKYYDFLLVVGFAIVCFSLIVQGLTIKPLIRVLGLSADKEELSNDLAHPQDGLT